MLQPYKLSSPSQAQLLIRVFPHDIECGKVIGTKTIAAATGHHSRDELATHTLTAIFTDLHDTAAFLKAVEI